MKLVVATHNPGKTAELAELLRPLDAECLTLDDAGINQDVEETGSSFAENAILKATSYAAMTGLLTVADDSGLEVDALAGLPGVKTARFGGLGLTHKQRYELLLDQIGEIPWEKRTARFRCVVALATGDQLLGTAEGVCEGIIAMAPAGDGGFGYDPVFFLPERGKTMAQLTAHQKHEISHRGRALKALWPLLSEALKG